MGKMVEIKIQVPENVDRLIREICKLDGSNVTEFYEEQLHMSLAGWLNNDEFFNTKRLAKIHGLHALEGLDPSMYGEYPEVKAE